MGKLPLYTLSASFSFCGSRGCSRMEKGRAFKEMGFGFPKPKLQGEERENWCG